MKIINGTIMWLALLIISILFLSFSTDVALLFMASADDKLYDDANKFNADGSFKDSYEFQQETTSFVLLSIEGFILILKVISSLIIPIAMYKLFVSKDSGAIEFLAKLFGYS